MSLPAFAAISFSISPSISGPAAAPVGDFTLNPLSVQGLWLAVITMPAAALRCTTSNEDICVGVGPAENTTGMSWARTTSAAATAKSSLAKRRSYAKTMPLDCSPRATTYSATAWAQRRTLRNE